ncbi:MAG: HK97 gp10 family phage protein [Tissierellia bacterium]|nr:HK97 gp10 family phage protein [Tissierellia bacterium]
MSCTFDVKDLEKYKDRLENIKNNMDQLTERACYNLALRVYRDARKNTPVDTGDLRKGWSITKIEKQDAFYQVRIKNDVEYADYVESGHRTRDHKRWIPGVFMLKIAEHKVEKEMDAIIQQEINKVLKL